MIEEDLLPVVMHGMSMECYPRLRRSGQVTIPEEIREVLDLEKGERIKLNVERLEVDE